MQRKKNLKNRINLLFLKCVAWLKFSIIGKGFSVSFFIYLKLALYKTIRLCILRKIIFLMKNLHSQVNYFSIAILFRLCNVYQNTKPIIKSKQILVKVKVQKQTIKKYFI